MENETLSVLSLYGLIPVVVLEDEAFAVPLADAYIKAGLPVMEVTLRTEAGLPAIRRITRERPEAIVGAGTVLTLEQCESAVKVGARFIVCPGLDEAIVTWCLSRGICVIPGCVTPTEITAALRHGIRTVKFFPASAYGGIKTMAALYEPFRAAGVSFIPTGGINLESLPEYADKPFISAVGGGWLCDKKVMSAGDFDRITQTVRESVNTLLGFELACLGIDAGSGEQDRELVSGLAHIFDMELRPGNSSDFAGSAFGGIRDSGYGARGHVTIRTGSILRARFYLEKKGFAFDESTAEIKNGKLVAICFRNKIGGFTLHLMQK